MLQQGANVKVGLFTFLGLYSQGLDTLANILTKGAEHAIATGTSAADLLSWRLAEDIFPLRRQAPIVCTFAKQGPARAAGLNVPPSLEGESKLSELHAAVADAKSPGSKA